MNFEEASEKYLALRRKVEDLERETKAAVADHKAAMVELENWFAARAQDEGITQIKTSLGTVYWSTHHSATVADRSALFAHCKENDAWDLVESRVSKTAVRSFIDGHGVPPPGVNFSSTQVFNLRKSVSKE